MKHVLEHAVVVARHPERTVADEASAEQRRCFDAPVADGQREAEALVGDRLFGVSAVDVVTGEARRVAEVLAAASAVAADSARPAEPWDADTRAELTLVRVGLERDRSASSTDLLKLSVPDVDPPLGLVIEARLRLVRGPDVVFERTYVERYHGGTLADWGADDAQKVRAARDASLDAVARQIAAELFGDRS